MRAFTHQHRTAVLVVWLLLALPLVAGCRFQSAPSLPFSAMLSEIEAGNVAAVVITSTQAVVTLRASSTGATTGETFVVELPSDANNSKLIEQLEANEIDFRILSR